MDKIVWDESFSVGIAEIDADHQQLAVLINLLNEHRHLPSDAPAIGEILAVFGSYADYHFGREEKRLAEGHCPDLRLHLQGHRQFQNLLYQIAHGATEGRVDMVRLVDFLGRWWPSHIRDQDMGLKKQPVVAAPH